MGKTKQKTDEAITTPLLNEDSNKGSREDLLEKIKVFLDFLDFFEQHFDHEVFFRKKRTLTDNGSLNYLLLLSLLLIPGAVLGGYTCRLIWQAVMHSNKKCKEYSLPANFSSPYPEIYSHNEIESKEKSSLCFISVCWTLLLLFMMCLTCLAFSSVCNEVYDASKNAKRRLKEAKHPWYPERVFRLIRVNPDPPNALDAPLCKVICEREHLIWEILYPSKSHRDDTMIYHELSYLIIKQLEEILDVSISNGDKDMLIPTENKLEEFHRRSRAMLVILRRKAKDYETSLQCNGDTGNATDDPMSDSMEDITQK